MGMWASALQRPEYLHALQASGDMRKKCFNVETNWQMAIKAGCKIGFVVKEPRGCGRNKMLTLAAATRIAPCACDFSRLL
jgi:hypothetical protein